VFQMSLVSVKIVGAIPVLVFVVGLAFARPVSHLQASCL